MGEKGLVAFPRDAANQHRPGRTFGCDSQIDHQAPTTRRDIDPITNLLSDHTAATTEEGPSRGDRVASLFPILT
jgi:hypothetical protein